MLYSKDTKFMDVNNHRCSLQNLRTLVESLSLIPNSEAKDLNVYKSYFKRLFFFFSERTEGLALMTLANYLPFNYFITENVYRSFHFHHHSHSYLKKDDFVKGMTVLYKGSFSERLSLLFDILDFNSDEIILADDVRVLFSHLYSSTNNSNLQDGYSIIDAFFQGEKSMAKANFILTTKRQNSDLFFLFIYLFNCNNPIDESSIDYYATHIYQKDLIKEFEKIDESNLHTNISDTHEEEEIEDNIIQRAFPSDLLYDFFNNNFNCSFIINSELDELDDFEENIEQVINENFTKCESILEPMSLKQRKMVSSCGLINKIEFDRFHFKLQYDTTPKPLSSTDLKTPSSNQLSNILFDNLFDFYTHSKDEQFSLHKLEIVGSDLYTYKTLSDSQLKFHQIFPLTQLYFAIDDNKRDSIGKVGVHLISTICNKFKDSLIYFDSMPIVNRIQRIIETKTKHRKIEDDYEFISVIGKGSFGTVLEAEKKTSKDHYAVKVMIKNYETELEIEQLKREKDITRFLMQFPYKGIVKIIDIYETYDTLYIVQEYIRNGSLKDFLVEKPHCKLPISLSYEITQQLIDSIGYLKSFGIVHRDLKTENVLIRIKHSKHNHSTQTHHQKIQTKIIDFGLSAIIGKEEKLTEKLGTLCYLPPEILSSKPYNFKIDIWTLGVICYCLLYGKHPFVQDNLAATIDKINHKAITLPEVRHDNEKEVNMRKLIEECLQRDIMFRPSIDSISKQFLSNFNYESEN